MNLRSAISALTGAIAAPLLAGPALAEPGQPVPWQIDFQDAVTPVMHDLYSMNILLSVIIIAISVFVVALVLYACWRFSEKRNPEPSRTTHNTLLEVVWTVVPIAILVIIAIPSFKLLYKADVIPDTEMTLKVIGHQWYWTYEYPDHGDLTFDAIMVEEEDLQPGQPRLLATDNNVVLPVDTPIKIVVTADDVLHNWAVPSFGIKIDTVPGRLNEVWINVEREGIYYGQCSELCGVNHSFMPIAVEVVSKEKFAAWVEQAKVEFARNTEPPVPDGPAAPVDVAAATGN